MAKQKKTQPKKKPATSQATSKPAVNQPKSEPVASKPKSTPAAEKPKKQPAVILVGMMGSGKTHIGKSLASKLGREFVDLDSLIESRCGESIPQIFATEGEKGFRLRESKLLAEICGSSNKVVATGGGVVITPQNRKILKKAPVIYLKVSPKAALARTKGSDRPLLQTKDPLETITKLIEKRAPWYEEVADVQFDSESKNVEEEILAWLAANKK